MEGRHVDVTVVTAEDLKKVNLVSKMHTYAVVWIDPFYRLPTPVDEAGGAKPRWNHQLSLPVPELFFQQPNASLTIEIYSKEARSRDKFVGAASVPVSEVAQKAGQESEQALAVRRRSGKVKGSVRVLVRVGERTVIGAAAPEAAGGEEKKQCCGVSDGGEASKGAPPLGYPSLPVPSFGYPPPSAAAYGYSPAPACAAPYTYPAPYPQAGYGQGYYSQQPAPYPAQARPGRRPGGGMGMGLGTGLLAGALGGLLLGDIVDGGGGFDCGGGFGF